MQSTTGQFLLLVLGVSVLFAGLSLTLVTLDKDYTYVHQESLESFPEFPDDRLSYYEDLPPDKQAFVDGALAGERYRVEEPDMLPTGLVKKDDTYHVFSSYAVVDVFNPPTLGSLGVVVVGLALSFEAIRRERLMLRNR